MNRKKELILLHSLLGLLVLPCMFVSCTNDNLDAGRYVPAPGELQVTANISSNATAATRAVYMHGNRDNQKYFLDSAEIGVSVVDATNGSAYAGGQQNKHFMVRGNRGDTYNNQYVEPVNGNTNAVGLLPGGAKACGYFPYRSDVTNIENIHWEQNPNNDIMYSKWTLSTSLDVKNPGTYLPLTETTPICDMTFHHAQSVLVCLVRNVGYNNESHISELTISGSGFGTKADLNAGTGVLSNITDTIFTQKYNPVLTFKTDSVRDLFYVFPNEQEKRIDFTYTIDGFKQHSHAIVALQQGYIYYFRFKMTSIKLEFEGVSIVPWNLAGIEAVESRPYIYNLDNHEYVDMGMTDVYGNKILWAKNNLGAADSTEVGYYYMWGQTHPTNENYMVGPSYYYKEDLGYHSISTTQYDAARALWGNENRMPTRYEWDYLTNASYYRWVDTTVVNGYGVSVKGYKVVSKADPRRTLFFPFTGFKTYRLRGLGTPIPQDTANIMVDETTTGCYWTGSQAVNMLPYEPIYLRFGKGSTTGYNSMQELHKDSVAYPIRAVKIWRKYDDTPFK